MTFADDFELERLTSVQIVTDFGFGTAAVSISIPSVDDGIVEVDDMRDNIGRDGNVR